MSLGLRSIPSYLIRRNLLIYSASGKRGSNPRPSAWELEKGRSQRLVYYSFMTLVYILRIYAWLVISLIC